MPNVPRRACLVQSLDTRYPSTWTSQSHGRELKIYCPLTTSSEPGGCRVALGLCNKSQHTRPARAESGKRRNLPIDSPPSESPSQFSLFVHLLATSSTTILGGTQDISIVSDKPSLSPTITCIRRKPYFDPGARLAVWCASCLNSILHCGFEASGAASQPSRRSRWAQSYTSETARRIRRRPGAFFTCSPVERALRRRRSGLCLHTYTCAIGAFAAFAPGTAA